MRLVSIISIMISVTICCMEKQENENGSLLQPVKLFVENQVMPRVVKAVPGYLAGKAGQCCARYQQGQLFEQQCYNSPEFRIASCLGSWFASNPQCAAAGCVVCVGLCCCLYGYEKKASSFCTQFKMDYASKKYR